MDVTQRLRALDDVVDEVLDRHEAHHDRTKGESRRRAYEKSLREVERIAGQEAATALAEWIETEIREKRRLPTTRRIRKRGATICRRNGHPVSTGSWLGA